MINDLRDTALCKSTRPLRKHFSPALRSSLPEQSRTAVSSSPSYKPSAPGSRTMGILLVFALCVCLPLSFSQSVVQTPASENKKECQSLTINCVFYGGFYARPLKRGDFFRQTQTGTEREKISSGGRFLMKTNTEEKTFSLEIRDVRVEDTATYYCKAEYRLPLSRKLHQIGGKKTQLAFTLHNSHSGAAAEYSSQQKTISTRRKGLATTWHNCHWGAATECDFLCTSIVIGTLTIAQTEIFH
ncbi:uncharacterized protein [Heterodontus francisci]|uniref:uncharacterized protein n=1 Tax=Heterodontus francisci TaxID=7792 RepID=UPI00355BB338